MFTQWPNYEWLRALYTGRVCLRFTLVRHSGQGHICVRVFVHVTGPRGRRCRRRCHRRRRFRRWRRRVTTTRCVVLCVAPNLL